MHGEIEQAEVQRAVHVDHEAVARALERVSQQASRSDEDRGPHMTIASSACSSKSSIVPAPSVIVLIALTFNSLTPSAM